LGIGKAKGFPEDSTREIPLEIGSSEEGLGEDQAEARLRVGHELAYIPLFNLPMK
jgi:hypothetical protein